MTVAFVPTAADPYGLGTDIALSGDLNPVWGLVTGFTNLGYALARRLNAELGSLFSDLAYGFDTNDIVNQALGPADVARYSQAIAGQCLLDERVQTCRATLSLVPQTGALTIAITGTIPQGIPFTFVMVATSVTVALLSVNGAPVAQPAAATTTPATAGTTIIIQGGSSEPGPAGPPGPAGGASGTFQLAAVEDNTGAEVAQPQTQIEVNFGALPASVTIELVGNGLSATGTATFRVRINGSDGMADGTVVATLTASSPSATPGHASTTIANPNGYGRAIVTVESNGPGDDAVLRDITLTIR